MGTGSGSCKMSGTEKKWNERNIGKWPVRTSSHADHRNKLPTLSAALDVFSYQRIHAYEYRR